MRNKISRYEENQVDRFLYDLYLLWGGNLDEDMCIGEGWIVYLEGREKYQYDIGDAEYWEYVRTNVKKLFLDLRKIRNNRIVMDDEIEIKKLPLFLRDIKHLRREHRSVIEIAEEIAGIIKQM